MKTGKEQVTRKNTENLPKPGRAVHASLLMEMCKNSHDSIQEVEGEGDKGFRKMTNCKTS
jgi:hypothetical protein